MPPKTKNLQIDMSTLTPTQKKMCVKLLAESNVDFFEVDDRFVAQIKIDGKGDQRKSAKKKKDLEKRALAQDKEVKGKYDQTKRKQKKEDRPLPPGKKLLCRTVKTQFMHNIDLMHPYIQVYVYPKRMSIEYLFQTIELIYQKFWFQQSNKKKPINLKSMSFSAWVYQNCISSVGSQSKIDQTIVNLLDSINHFQIKWKSVKIFKKFLSEEYGGQSLCYFLVLRGLIQEIIGQKIIERGKLRMNPNQKHIQEERIIQFLNIFCQKQISCSKHKSNSYRQLFSSLTSLMFYDEVKKKNYIEYFDLVQHLLKEYMNIKESQESQFFQMQISQSNIFEQKIFTQSQNSVQDGSYEHPIVNYDLKMQKQQKSEKKELQFPTKKFEDSFHDQLTNQCMLKLNQMCNILSIPVPQLTTLLLKNLLNSIVSLDKKSYLDSLLHQPRQSQILYLQNLQLAYKKRMESSLPVGQLAKKVMNAPGIRQSLTGHIVFP